ncbi:uncharacterized protein LOC131155649 isoform X2 [Malania oleifera]|nr:uncharacterized protein LOC131155649 isoform X2 [Malania oleifera]
MVQNFIEDSNEKQSAAIRCGRNRCNCFNGNSSDGSGDESDAFDSNLSSYGEACEILKSLVPCASVAERNLLADTAKIVEKNKICKRKDDFCRKIVTDGLLALGYDASTCKSRWEKSPSYPAGEYQYVDVIVDNERLLIDIDFRSEFEIARSTKNYKVVLQTLPYIFVGKPDRLQKIISVITEAAKQSLKKKGMHFPPWRKADYVKAKWLSPYTRLTPTPTSVAEVNSQETKINPESNQSLVPAGKFQLKFGEKSCVDETEADLGECVFPLSGSSGEEEDKTTVTKKWKPPEIKPKNSPIGVKMVTGLGSVFGEKP